MAKLSASVYILVLCFMTSCLCSWYHFTIILCCFSNSEPPFILTSPIYWISEFFPTPLFLRTPCLFGTWEYVISLTAFCIVLPLIKAIVTSYFQFQLFHSTILLHAVLKFWPLCHKQKWKLLISFHEQDILLQ